MRSRSLSGKFLAPGRRRRVARVLTLVVFAGMLATPYDGTASPGTFERASVTSNGGQANAGSTTASISSDGAVVAFQSLASNLGSGDTNGTWDIFLRFRTAPGTTVLISGGLNGQPAAGPSRAPSLAAAPRTDLAADVAARPFTRVAYESDAANLVAGDTNGLTDVFLYNSGTTRISVSSTGGQANGRSFAPAIDGTGRFVAFQSLASNLIAGDTNQGSDVFVRDVANATTVRVSVSSSGTQASGGVADPSISPDGRYVAFVSRATLAAGDTNVADDVFLHDRDTDADGIYDETGSISTERVSVSHTGQQANAGSGSPSISIDGQSVTFTSTATNLVPSDTNGVQDVFVRSRPGGTTRRASVATDGTQANAASRNPVISAPGEFVVFESDATNLIASDANLATDVFLRDVNSGTTSRESEVPASEANGPSRAPVISVAGTVMAWDTDSMNLAGGADPFGLGGFARDSNGAADVIVHERTLPTEPDDPCLDAEPPWDDNGNVDLPPDAEEIVTTDVDEPRGLVSGLYPAYDTTDASWYEGINCEWSIGGTVPQEAYDPDIDGELAAQGIDATMEELSEDIDLAADNIKGWADQNRDENSMWGDLEPVGCMEELPLPEPPIAPPPAPFPPVEPIDPTTPREVRDILKRIPPVPALPAAMKAVVDRLGMPDRPGSRTRSAGGPCDPLPPVDESNVDPSHNFSGRDIIFIHGYRTTPIFDKLGGISDAMTEWRFSKPGDRAQFLNPAGYWRRGAVGYWKDHIARWIDPQSKNRYLVVAWPSTQWLPYGLHATLFQIAHAIRNSLNVVDPTGSPVPPGDFCRSKCVVVSHSAGGLLTDVAMTLAELSKYSGPVRSLFGNMGFIADRVKAHVAVQPALKGSTYATVLAALGLALASTTGLCALAQLIVNKVFNGNINCLGQVTAIIHSVTIDLVPPITHALWGGLINLTPVRTLTVAGGHPTAIGTDATGDFKPLLALILHRLHRGFDDGVLTANSQCGTPTGPGAWPSGFIAKHNKVDQVLNSAIGGPAWFTPVTSKVYDMGIHPARAVPNYIDQVGDRYLSPHPTPLLTPYYAAATCHSFLSPTGMVQPVDTVALPAALQFVRTPPGVGLWAPTANAANRFLNHHSFIISSSDHFWGPTLNSSENVTNQTPDTLCYEETLHSSAYCSGTRILDNWEESMGWTRYPVVEPNIYPDLVNPDFGNLPEERIKGLKIEFKRRILGIKIPFKYWIWKRTYHNLVGAEDMVEMDYVYEYVLR